MYAQTEYAEWTLKLLLERRKAPPSSSKAPVVTKAATSLVHPRQGQWKKYVPIKTKVNLNMILPLLKTRPEAK